MFKMPRARRRALFGSTVAGVALGALAVAGPAGATVVPTANGTIVVSGGNTPYALIQSVATVFNESQGCNLLVPKGFTNQTYDFSCPTGGGLPAGDPPNGYGNPSVNGQYSDNAFNDVAVVEPSISSSAGITQLENQGSHTTNTAAIDVASIGSSSATPASSVFQGINYVNYASDGVDYLIWTKVGSTATKQAKLKGLSQAQLQGIWSGTDKCWSDVGVKKDDTLINPYSVVTTSTITSTFDAYLAPDNSETYVQGQTSWPPAGVKCKDGKTATYAGPSFSNYGTSHTILQNQVQSILDNKDEAEAIVFISVGRDSQLAKSASFAGTALGAVGSPAVKPTESTILDGSYPIPLQIVAAYSNGSNSKIPVASSAALNFASEVGFLCKANTVDGTANGSPIIDPKTGVSYRSEIDQAILSEGFFPLDGNTGGKPFDEGSVTHPATSISSFTSSKYHAYDTPPTETNGDPVGFCKVTTSDGNANS